MDFIKETTEKLYAIARKYGVNLSDEQLRQFSNMVEDDVKRHPTIPEEIRTPDAKEYYVLQSVFQQLPTPEQAETLRRMRTKPKDVIVATDIDWDTDGEDVDLPKTVIIPIDDILYGDSRCAVTDDDLSERAGNYLSEKFGFCHFGFSLLI